MYGSSALSLANIRMIVMVKGACISLCGPIFCNHERARAAALLADPSYLLSLSREDELEIPPGKEPYPFHKKIAIYVLDRIQPEPSSTGCLQNS